jgi:hypothetical protein
MYLIKGWVRAKIRIAGSGIGCGGCRVLRVGRVGSERVIVGRCTNREEACVCVGMRIRRITCA